MSGLILPVTLDGERITISQNYGDDFSWKGYSHYYRQYYGLDGHNGIDFGGWGIDGEPVSAAGDGTVVYAGTGDYWDSTVGGGSFTVVIYHPHLGVWTAYLHLRNNSNTVTAGQKVKQGQMIARAGNTGIGTGAHLHFQVMPVAPLPLVYQPNWGCVNPKPYMQRITAQAATTVKPIQEDDMPFTDWPKKDQDAMVKAIHAYKRRNEKVDASHMVAYIYNAIKRVDIATQAIWKVIKPLSLTSIANAVARRPVTSRHPASVGKTYAWETFDSVTNANSHSADDKLDAIIDLLGDIAANKDATAEELRAMAKEAVSGLSFKLVTLDEVQAESDAKDAEVTAQTEAAADAAIAEATATTNAADTIATEEAK